MLLYVNMYVLGNVLSYLLCLCFLYVSLWESGKCNIDSLT